MTSKMSTEFIDLMLHSKLTAVPASTPSVGMSVSMYVSMQVMKAASLFTDITCTLMNTVHYYCMEVYLD